MDPLNAARTPRDGVLVGRSLAGDHGAYGQLVDRYGSVIRGIALYHGAREDAEDVVQEVFLRAWSALSQLQRRDRFAPWLAQIARNTGRTWSQRRRLRSNTERCFHPQGADSPTTPHELTEARQSADLVHEALCHLSPEHRMLVCLHYLEGCSYRQIARCLNMPLATVRLRVLQAMSRLRARLPRDLATYPRRVGDPSPRRRVLGALAALGLGDEVAATTAPPLPPTWLASHRLVVAAFTLSALVHLGLLEMGPWDEERRLAVRFGRRDPFVVL
jgi:RNA polymerase sigma-70 factor (ECF subfamily)